MANIPRKRSRLQVTRCIALDDELVEGMQFHDDVNWSEVCRKAIKRTLKRLDKAENQER